MEASIQSEETPIQTTEQKKYPLSPERLKQLELARARAAEVKRQKKLDKQREEQEAISRAQRMEQELRSLKEMVAKTAAEPEPEPEQEQAEVKKPKTKKPRKIVIEESSSSDDETEYVVVKKRKAAAPPAQPPPPEVAARQEFQHDINRHTVQQYKKRVDEAKMALMVKSIFGE